jgi:predicted RND superfamily exporter protein
LHDTKSKGGDHVPEPRRSYRAFEFINRRIGWVAFATVVVALALSVIGPMVQTEEEANFSPTGEIYDVDARAVDLFTSESAIAGAAFIVEDPARLDALSQPVLAEFKERSDALRTETKAVQDRPLNERLARGVDLDLGIEIDGIFSIADAVDAHLGGRLATATNADVKVALAEMFDENSPTSGLLFTLARQATFTMGEIDGAAVPIWESPAFLAQLRYRYDSFEGATDQAEELNAEAWLIEVQRVLRDGADGVAADAELNVWGVAIDFGTAFNQSFQEGGPYVFLAVALIVLLVGALMRSYWAATVAALGLGVTMLAYSGLTALLTLEVSPLLQLIVPIAMISFGIDFFIHGAGRVRETQIEGVERSRAYPIGASAVFMALLLAATTSAAAFLSNAVSDIEAIREFGVGAAVALLLAYFVLGVVAPRVLLGIEERVGPGPLGRSTFRMAPYKVLFTIAAILAGVMVSMTVVFPVIGGPLFLVHTLLFAYLPYLWTRRRNRRAAEKGREVGHEIRGAGHGFTAAGSIVHFLARWRVVTVPVVVVIAVIGTVLAFRVEKDFEIQDFLPSDTDTVASLERFSHYFTAEGDAGGTGYLLVEGDLTDPSTLRSMQTALDSLTASTAPFARDFEGAVQVAPNAVSIVQTAMSSPRAIDAVENASGIGITDDDGDGFPDTADQVAAVYEYAFVNGIPQADGTLILRPDIVQSYLHVGTGTQATRLEVIISSFTDEAVIDEGLAELTSVASDLRSEIGDEATVGISGGPIINADTLDGFVESMLLSLPIALVLAILLAGLAMRSVRYAVASMVPVLIVVSWVYGYMVLAGLTINPVTATIAAVAIGVGIDFATHFTVRFREEFVGEPSRFPALRRAGEGTGGALALSALTSILGFWALSLAPTPIFAAFGQLTVVMIFFSLVVSLLVLPSILLLLTPGRKGSLRERLTEEITGGEWEYDPHARQTALRNPTEA